MAIKKDAQAHSIESPAYRPLRCNNADKYPRIARGIEKIRILAGIAADRITASLKGFYVYNISEAWRIEEGNNENTGESVLFIRFQFKLVSYDKRLFSQLVAMQSDDDALLFADEIQPMGCPIE